MPDLSDLAMLYTYGKTRLEQGKKILYGLAMDKLTWLIPD